LLRWSQEQFLLHFEEETAYACSSLPSTIPNFFMKIDYIPSRYKTSAVPPEKRVVEPPVNWQVIIINDMVMNELNSEENKQSVIAHELAHVYLQHSSFSEKKEKKDKDKEQEANDLIRSWGFRPNIKPLLNTKKMAHRAKERKRHD
jgi:hypothetical protein